MPLPVLAGVGAGAAAGGGAALTQRLWVPYNTRLEQAGAPTASARVTAGAGATDKEMTLVNGQRVARS